MKLTGTVRRATGVVRRMDELGRIVVPKEIRRTMRIREGDPLEIFTQREEIIFKKYSPIGELAVFAGEYAETLHKTCALSVVICDRDAVIATAGVPRKEYADKMLSEEMERILEGRALFVQREGDAPVYPTSEGGGMSVRCAMPILAEGDIVGCVCSLGGEEENKKAPSIDVEIKLIQTAAGFLGRQLEN